MAKRKPTRPRKNFLPESVQDAMAPSQASARATGSPFGTPGGVLDDRRIATCADARELFVRLQYENQLRAQAYAQVRNQIEGGRPFDPATLARNGEQWRTNCNFNDARSAFNRISSPYWKAVHEVPRVASIKIHSSSPHADEWGVAMSEAFDMFLEDWNPDYYDQFSGFCDDMILFGPGYGMWQDAISPRWKWAQSVQLLFPRRTKTSVDDWELVCLKREMTADQLIKHVRDNREAKKAEKAGWNPDAIHRAIQLASPQPMQTKFLDPNYWQDMIVTNDLNYGVVWPPISVVDLWAVNRSGKIEHKIFTETADVGDYLYESVEDADSFRDIFGTCTYTVGSNGLLHAIKGYGVLNYYYMTVINRLKCKATDAVGMTMSLNFTKDDNTPDETPPVENFSFVNIFPRGLNQLQVYPQLQGAMQLMQSLQQNENENNYQYNEVREEIGNTDTATQAKLLAGIGAEMQTANMARFLMQYGKNFLTPMLKRLCAQRGDPDAKKFRERCKKLGVPEEVLSDKYEKTVKTGASPTMASPMVRRQIGAQLMGTIYNLPGANRRWIEEFVTTELLGVENGKHALLPVGVNSDPRARREAMQENADLAAGIPLPVDPSDAHAEHADEHLKGMEGIVGAAQAGQPITPDHLIALQMTQPHVTEHLNYLSQDDTKAQIFKQLNARAKMVQNVARGIESRMARAGRNGAAPDEIRTQLQAPRQ